MSHDKHASHHVIPFAVLTRTFIALVILTVLTVICARIHLGSFEAPVAFLIAIAKALLVITFFMGMKYDSNSNRIIFGTAFVFLAIFAFFSILDIWTRIAQFNTL
jgi:cytochrome c oxidase subunit 4